MADSPKTIDAYTAQFPPEVQALLETVRRCIADAAPDASEKMAYGIPTFFLVQNLVHYAAMKHHLGFYPTPSGILHFAAALKPYTTTKGAVHFPYDAPLPTDLIAQITRFRVKENLSAAKK